MQEKDIKRIQSNDKARERISRVIGERLGGGVTIASADDMACMFIAALPDMVTDLVWGEMEEFKYNDLGYAIEMANSTSGAYALKFYDFPIHESIAKNAVATLKRKANAHHRARVMAAFGIGGV